MSEQDLNHGPTEINEVPVGHSDDPTSIEFRDPATGKTISLEEAVNKGYLHVERDPEGNIVVPDLHEHRDPSSVVPGPNYVPLAPEQTPRRPTSPHHKRNVALGVAAGAGLAVAGVVTAFVTGVLGSSSSADNDTATKTRPTHPVATAPQTPGESTPPTTPETKGPLTALEKAGELGQVGGMPTEAQFAEAKKPVVSKDATAETASIAAVKLAADWHIALMGATTDIDQGYAQRETQASIDNENEILANVNDPDNLYDRAAFDKQRIVIADFRYFTQNPNNIPPSMRGTEPSLTETYKVTNVEDNGDGTWTVNIDRTVTCNFKDFDGTFGAFDRKFVAHETNRVAFTKFANPQDGEGGQWKSLGTDRSASPVTVITP